MTSKILMLENHHKLLCNHSHKQRK